MRNSRLLLAHPWNWNKRLWPEYAQHTSWRWCGVSHVNCKRSILQQTKFAIFNIISHMTELPLSNLSNLLSQALFHFVTDLPSVFPDHSKSGRPILANYNFFLMLQKALLFFRNLPDRPCTVLPTAGRLFAVSLNELFCMTFHLRAPAVIFPDEHVSFVWSFSSVSPVVVNFLNDSVWDWTAWWIHRCLPLRASQTHLIYQWCSIFEVDFFLPTFPHGFSVLPFSNHFYIVHVDRED